MKTLFFALFLLVAGGLVVAQDNQAQSPNTPNEPAREGKVETIRGCLSRTGKTYIVLGNNPMRQYRVTGGDFAALKHLLNHTVEITGPVGHVESGASDNGKYGPASTTGVGYDTIIAKSVKNASDNCGL